MLLPAQRFFLLHSSLYQSFYLCVSLSLISSSPLSLSLFPSCRPLPFSCLFQVQIIILDEQMQLQPFGVKGEMFVAGPTLARGYLNRPDLNAERFLPRPSHLPAAYGERLYRCGDWGLRTSNGGLEITGRCDSMVKIRGYR